MVKRMSAQQARDKFGEMIDSVRYTGEPVMVEKRGKVVSVMVSVDDYEDISKRRLEAAWQGIDALREANAHLDPDYIYELVTSEIEAMRREGTEAETQVNTLPKQQ